MNIKNKPVYKKEIDGLRALAVISVILFHAGLPKFSGGFVGVDIFFVISGYLITSIIFYEKFIQKFNLIYFFERRARRILPALFSMILLTLPFVYLWFTPRDTKIFSESLIAVSVFLSNIFFWKTSGYFAPSAQLSPLLHTWSLAVEGQFYLLYPFFILLIWRANKFFIYLVFIVCFLASLFLSDYLSEAKANANFFILPTRGWELLSGSILAVFILTAEKLTFNRLISETACFLGFVLIYYSVFNFSNLTPFPSFYTLLPVIGTILIILYTSQETLIGKFLSSKFLVGIGLISYSLYLFHQPIFAIARYKISSDLSPPLIILLIIFTFLISFLSYKYIEIYFKNKIDKYYFLLLASLFSVLLICLGFFGYFTNGFIDLKTSSDQRLLFKTVISSPKRETCHTGGENYTAPEDACEFFSGNLNIATFGDSHTVELAYSLAEDLRPYKLKLKQLSFSGCAPVFKREDFKKLNVKMKFCYEWTKKSVDYIVENKDIQTVVVSYRINKYLFGSHEKKYPYLINEVNDSEREILWRSYINLLQFFIDNGKNVILVLQAPELPKPVDFLIMASKNTQGEINGVSYTWWSERSKFVKERISQIPKNVLVIDPEHFLCDKLNCFAAKNGITYYFDDNHLSLEGADLIAKEIVRLGYYK